MKNPEAETKECDAVLSFYDAWDAAVSRDRLAGPGGFVCPPDCCRCCENSPAVPVTAPEALVAARAVAALPPGLGERVRERVRAVAARVEETGESASAPPPPGVKGACALLEDGRCSIYAARPLFCRAYGFSAEGDGSYFGCEVLYPALMALEHVALTSLEAGRKALPRFRVLDGRGHELPECGMLAELVDRLLNSSPP